MQNTRFARLSPQPALFLLLAPFGAAGDDVSASGSLPLQWYLEEIATLTAGSGRWIADNSAYRNEQEPYDSYATEWQSSFDGVTMTGRLFGIKDGKETGNFWEFRQYWHPGRKEAVLEQFGWGGAIMIGTAWREGNVTKSAQTFFTFNGSSSRTGHISHFPDADTYVTDSFDIDGENWLPRRSYVWKRSDSR